MPAPGSPTHGPRRALVAALALGAALVIVFVVAISLRGGSKQPPVGAPPSTGTPAQQADAFSTWLRDHAADK